jgi:hypothetical protein
MRWSCDQHPPAPVLQHTHLFTNAPPPPTRWAIAHLAYITVGGWLFSVVKSIDRFVAAQRRDVCRVP